MNQIQNIWGGKLLALGLMSHLFLLLPGCATTPGWPIENIGTAQFSGNLSAPGNVLIVPSEATRIACQNAATACNSFAGTLTRTVNSASPATVYRPRNSTSFSLVYEDSEAVEAEIDRVGAQSILVWDIGIIDDRKNFSFGPDAFSISTLRVIDVGSRDVAIQMMKPYGLINPNTEDFSALAEETGRRLGSALAQNLY